MPLCNSLADHSVYTAYELDWARLRNGELLTAAEDSQFDIFITTDRNLQYQQDLTTRKISIIVLSATSWRRISLATDKTIAAIGDAGENSFVEVEIP